MRLLHALDLSLLLRGRENGVSTSLGCCNKGQEAEYFKQQRQIFFIREAKLFRNLCICSGGSFWSVLLGLWMAVFFLCLHTVFSQGTVPNLLIRMFTMQAWGHEFESSALIKYRHAYMFLQPMQWMSRDRRIAETYRLPTSGFSEWPRLKGNMIEQDTWKPSLASRQAQVDVCVYTTYIHKHTKL